MAAKSAYSRIRDAAHAETREPRSGREVLLVGTPYSEERRESAQRLVARPQQHVTGPDHHRDLRCWPKRVVNSVRQLDARVNLSRVITLFAHHVKSAPKQWHTVRS